MPKVTTTICLDVDVYNAAREIYENLSGAINTLLSQALVEKKPEAKETLDWVKKTQDLEQKYAKLRKKYDKRLEKWEELKDKTTVKWSHDPLD